MTLLTLWTLLSIPAAHWQSLANAGAASLDDLAAAAARTPKQGAAA